MEIQKFGTVSDRASVLYFSLILIQISLSPIILSAWHFEWKVVEIKWKSLFCWQLCWSCVSRNFQRASCVSGIAEIWPFAQRVSCDQCHKFSHLITDIEIVQNLNIIHSLYVITFSSKTWFISRLIFEFWVIDFTVASDSGI